MLLNFKSIYYTQLGFIVFGYGSIFQQIKHIDDM